MQKIGFGLLALALMTALPAFAQVEEEHGYPGIMPGTETWIVELDSRPFDLLPLRRAFREGRSAADIAELIATLEKQAREHQAGLAARVEALGGRVVRHWWLINACAVEIPFAELPALRRHAGVRRLFPDRRVEPAGAPILKATNAANHSVDLPQGLGIRGAKVTVAVPDSGFDISNKGGTTPFKPNPTFYVNGDPNNTSGGGLQGSRILVARQMATQPIDAVDGHGTAVTAVAAGEKWSKSANADRGQAPAAGLALYCWAIDTAGGTTLTYMVNTWQQIVTDKAKYNILVANNSFQGSAPPTWPEQQAMDAAVLNADIFIAAMCGNYGGSTHYSNGATNILTVGSVAADTRIQSAFSSYGPLWWSTSPHTNWNRNYPDLVANGEVIYTAKADGGDYQGSGTSYATPQVVGAAALYRGVRTAASALETRAAILATLQDISAANPASSANGYGMGYLRTDKLVQVAMGSGTRYSGALSATNKNQKFSFTAKAGVRYAAALCWNRHDLTKFDYSDLDLQVKAGTQVLATAATHVGNTNERLVFATTTAGKVDIEVQGFYLESVSTIPFVVMVVEETLPYVPARLALFGKGCLGSGGVPELTTTDRPLVGSQYNLTLSKINLFTTSICLTGLSKTTWGGYTLPLDLGWLGAKGCSLLTGGNLILPMFLGSVSFNLPRDPALLGGRLYHQALILDTKANAGGFVVSNGLDVAVGGSI